MAAIRNDLNVLCTVCGAKVVSDVLAERECAECGKKEYDREVCEKGHYVCDECRRKSASKIIIKICSSTDSKNPADILTEIMDQRCVRMHDLKHHTAVGASLLAAYKNSGGNVDLGKALREMDKRGSWFPGGLCGLAGTCGAAASAGAFYSIVTNTTPHSEESWGDVNLLVSECLHEIGSIKGPRCCKRNSFISLTVAAGWVERKLGVKMEMPSEIACKYSERNDECVKDRCPFFR